MKKKKFSSFNWNLLKYLFWLSPMLIVMGLTAGAIAGWGVVPTGLVVIGAVLGLTWLALSGVTQKGFWGRRSTQEGTNALIATVAALVILGFVNVLAARYTARLDLTENKIFTLAPQSQLVAQQLQNPVKAVIFMPNADPVDEQLLKNYQRQGKQFSYEYVDPQAEPGVAQQFGVQSFGEVYLESGDVRRYVQTISAQERLSERNLTNGLVQLTSSSQQIVYFLQGHGERSLDEGQGGFAQAKQGLADAGYEAVPLNLAENPTIPGDTGMLIVAGPQRPLLESEVKALRDYLKRKSAVLLLIDPQTDPNISQTDFGLNPLLEEWGVRLSDRIVIDPAGEASGLGPGVTIVNQYGDHPITQQFGNGISFYPLARPLETASIAGVESAQLLITSAQTEGHRLSTSSELEFDPATDPKGPFNIGIALSRNVEGSANTEAEANAPSEDAEGEPPQAESPNQARLVVIGNASFAGNGLFNQQLNGDVFLNSVSWLNNQQNSEALSVRPREMTNRRIVMSPGQQITSALISTAFLPILGFTAAVFVWWRRR